MSIQALAPVIESGLYSGAAYAVLISMANHADEHGELWIGKATIASEARMSERHVQRVLKQLVADGAIEMLGENTGPWGTNEYRLDIDRFEAAQAKLKAAKQTERAKRKVGRPPKKRGDTMSPPLKKGETSEANGGDIAVSGRGDIAVSSEPSVTDSKPSRGRAREDAPPRAARSSRRGRRGKRDEDPPPPPPQVTREDLQDDLDRMNGADRAIIFAALNGHQRPSSLRLCIGRFAVVRSLMEGCEGDLSLAVFDGGDATRRYLTGAAEHLGIQIRCWSPDGVQRAIDKGRIERPARDPWGVELKPEIEESASDAA